ncbi:glycosyl hydrolase [uncultured Bacteroides sp.]|uniref:glycosyl hydrolase n=1 Tax=uncultured Bacteroides sp. TaxID=162156 RepID=UPI00262E1EEA|nr:glycosyl hydrolase [uncultured Bacteroides sp.]
MKKIIVFLLLLGNCFLSYSQRKCFPGGTLEQVKYGFLHIQDSARTKMWWFHGKIPFSHEGLVKDLESFKKVGLGGVVFYDQVHGESQPGTEKAMSREWWQNLYTIARTTKKLGLSLEFHVSNGFVAGGPWITPKYAMKRLDCLETFINGGRYIDTVLINPQNRYNYYKDVRILAIPTFDDRNTGLITSNREEVEVKDILCGTKLVNLSASSTPLLINIDYRKPVTLRSISYSIGSSGKATTSATNVPAEPQENFIGTGYRILPPIGELQASEDGEVFYKVCDLKPLYRAHESYNRKTISFLPVRARFYRIKLSGWDGAVQGLPLRIGNMVLGSDSRINEYEYKAAYISDYIEHSMESPQYTNSESIRVDKVLDITKFVGKNGRLRWKVPKGNWKILRFCMVPTGGNLKHGRENLMGLECDKMSVAAAELQFDNYFRQILDSLSNHHINNVQGMVMDSHEAGSQNWTDDFLEAFKERRGYDLTPYLPVMAGYIVENVRSSESILYDVRLTIADLIAERYYGTFDTLCRKEKLTFTAQATGNAQCIVAIPIVAKGKVQKPQGEFWLIHPDGNYDIKESSSAAHLYDKPIASAEAFTDGKINTMPCDMKSIADVAYSFGINEFVGCASAHQPDSCAPGYAGGRVYSTYTRNNTWWNKSRDFWDYQARISYVMRQGRPVIDLCVFLGNNAPTRILTHRLPKIPSGYDFDAFTEDALLNRMSADVNGISLPSGQSYSMMILPRSGEISLEALRKIASMVKEGAKVYGNRPKKSPCKNDLSKDVEYNLLVDTLWSGKPYGKGMIFSDMTLNEALCKAGISPDVKGKQIHFAHRETNDCDIYFLHNHHENEISDNYRFRTKYSKAQLWDAVTGKRYELDNDKGNVKLNLSSQESCFIIFSDEYEELPKLPICNYKREIGGTWNVEYSLPNGVKRNFNVSKLESWTKNKNPEICYYSGTAIYTNRFEWNGSQKTKYIEILPNRCFTEVYINEKRVGSIWGAPWRLDVTDYIKYGENEIRLEVTNSWNNSLVGVLNGEYNLDIMKNPELFKSQISGLQNAGLEGSVLLLY